MKFDELYNQLLLLENSSLLLEASPIKELEKAVNLGKITPSNQKEYEEALNLYKNNSELRGEFDPFSKQFRDETNNVDIDTWINNILIASKSKSIDKSLTKHTKDLSKAYKIIEDNSEYQILAIYSHDANYVLNAQNYYVNKCTDDHFTMKPHGYPKPDEDNINQEIEDIKNSAKLPTKEYAQKIAEAPFYMIPSWCIASENKAFWTSYMLSDADFPQVFLVLSKKYANWRFMITFDADGELEEVRDPWQTGVGDTKNRGLELMTYVFGNTDKIFNIINNVINDINDITIAYRQKYRDIENKKAKLIEDPYYRNKLILSDDIRKIKYALQHGADINIKLQSEDEEIYTPLLRALNGGFSPETVLFLLKNGAKLTDFDDEESYNDTLLFYISKLIDKYDINTVLKTFKEICKFNKFTNFNCTITDLYRYFIGAKLNYSNPDKQKFDISKLSEFISIIKDKISYDKNNLISIAFYYIDNDGIKNKDTDTFFFELIYKVTGAKNIYNILHYAKKGTFKRIQ